MIRGLTLLLAGLTAFSGLGRASEGGGCRGGGNSGVYSYSGAGGHWVGAPAYSAVAPSLPVSNTGYTGYPAPVASGWGYPAPRQGGAFYPIPGYGGWGQRVMYPR